MKSSKLALIPFVLGLFALPLFSQSGFTEVSLVSGMDHLYHSQSKMGGGAAIFDLDGDGDEDIILTGGLDKEGLFENLGNGQFQNITYAAGLGFMDSVHTMGVITGDIDNDGFRELFFTTGPNEPNVLLYNNGNKTFTNISLSSNIAMDTSWSTSATFFDFEADGDLDIYVGNYVSNMDLITDSMGVVIGFDPTCEPNFLFVNNGNLTFTEAAASYGLADSGCVLAVTNTNLSGKAGNSNWGSNLYVANDFGEYNIPNRFFRANYLQSNSHLEESTAMGLDIGMYGMGIAIGDYDHNGYHDYYVTNIGKNKLFQSTGDFWANGFTFNEVALAAGVINDSLNGLNTTGWGTAFMDYDNDSWEDLFVCNGQISVVPFIANVAADPDMLYRNRGDGTFEDVGMALGIGDTSLGRGMIYGDYDNDGDLDALTMPIHWDTASGFHTMLYRNDINNGNHWIKFKLQGTASNRDAFGCGIRTTVNGEIIFKEINGGASHMSQNTSIIHIGLGSATSITDSLHVFWTKGTQTFAGPFSADSTYLLIEDSLQYSVGIVQNENGLSKMKVFPNPTNGTFILELPLAYDSDIQVDCFDMAGKKLRSWSGQHHQGSLFVQQFDADYLPKPGAYLIKVSTKYEVKTAILIKE